ncbi:MAG: hypothetical protein FJ033_11800 [Chloroflexi bacterium]|nr:hypothetical protein [Chloroflexota bacterium]
MVSIADSPASLEARRQDLDAQIVNLKRRRAQLDAERQRLEEARRRGSASASLLQENRDSWHAVNRLISTREREALDTERALWSMRLDRSGSEADAAVLASLQTSADLDDLRRLIVGALRELAEPLSRYEHLAERQQALGEMIAANTGSDNRYATYLDTALLRDRDGDEDVVYVLSLLRRMGVVA